MVEKAQQVLAQWPSMIQIQIQFGALGHGITDIDTGTLMPVNTGEILVSNILE